MLRTAHQRRLAELRELQHIDPRAIINTYCEITGRYCGNQLPHQTSFAIMIAAIAEHECRAKDDSLDKIAGGRDN